MSKAVASVDTEKVASTGDALVSQQNTTLPGKQNERVGFSSIPNDTNQNDSSLTLQETSPDDRGIVYLQGVRFWPLASVIFIILFLSSIDVTITTTSLVAITNDLGGFEMASWVLSAYQLGCVALIVIIAKFSDILGRKPLFMGSVLAFGVFSGACAASQTTEAVPPEKLNLALVLALVQGPLLGGTISSHTTWKWIFLINVPICAASLILAQIGIPNGFPYHERTGPSRVANHPTATKFARLDLIGSALVLLVALLFTACFQEADSRFPWKSAYVITLLIVSTALWAITLIYERHLTLYSKVREPVMPWRFFTHRVRAGVMVGFLLVGVPATVTMFQLSQRFQLVNGLSSIDAGVRILLFGLSFCGGSFAASKLAGKLQMRSIYLILVGAVFQAVGFALLSVLKPSVDIRLAVYGYQVLCGFGVGLNYLTPYLLVPLTADKRDTAVGIGLATQCRVMGSAFGLAIVTSGFNGYLRSQLAKHGLPVNLANIEALLTKGQATFTPDVAETIRNVLLEAYNRQMLVVCAFSAAQTLVVLLIWKRQQTTAR
ncbi:MFS-type transporter MFS54-like protein [Cladobotryum mycophilum]|uniref:MFS-type transporter MFS54-like protein n=1 Tax=Cladobotryum mycophilum TaxID=491253 RepID=A0ABR0S8D4_9HYPO